MPSLPENEINYGPGIRFHILLLDVLYHVVIVLQVAFARGVFPRGRTSKQNRLRDVGDSGQHIAGAVDNLFHAGCGRVLEIVLFPLIVNGNRIEDTPRHIDNLKAL